MRSRVVMNVSNTARDKEKKNGGDCRDIDDGGYGLDYSEDIIPDSQGVPDIESHFLGDQMSSTPVDGVTVHDFAIQIDNDNVSNEAQPITGGQSQGIAAQEPKRKKAKSRPASASEDCRDIDDGGYGLDYSEDIIPDNDNVSNEAQPITGGQSQGIAAQEPKRKKAKSRPASASEAWAMGKGNPGAK
ncbi:hypothetical protein ACOMHN_059063 [Nucella lapillus]